VETSKRTPASSGRTGTGRTTSSSPAASDHAPAAGSGRGRVARKGRSPRTASTRPRRTPGIASSLGVAFALTLVSLFTQIPWAVKIALVATALLGIAGYVTVHVVHMFDQDNEDDDAPAGPDAPAAPENAPDAPSDDKDAAQ
jgi:hypothetical protein